MDRQNKKRKRTEEAKLADNALVKSAVCDAITDDKPVAKKPVSTMKITTDIPLTNFLLINDASFTDDSQSYKSAFELIANELINKYELIINSKSFRICEIEFYYYSQKHLDPFTHQHSEQKKFPNWYFHRSGKSLTASWKNGTYKGLDLTFGNGDDETYGGILIRSIQNKQTNEIFEGSCLVVDTILNIAGVTSIKELIENKMKNNVQAFNKNSMLYLNLTNTPTLSTIVMSPRVGLTLKVGDKQREKFLFRSYRFTPNDFYPSKMKSTIILALAAEKFFKTDQKLEFNQFLQELTNETSTRINNVKTYLSDLQTGFNQKLKTDEIDSPLKSYYGKAFSSSDICRAYGTWLKVFGNK
ncbi:unnamed protein product [Didymodactylos carnosus]|uniref:Uncharacterized protein n=1 Tax=Didymodactylos carnosus TaxID=1234261 RepID=A0A813UKB9_9BILA|nr:unnamed protein product [Didymodactylos carnosus]CAF0830370.1 unnamed protein product [Didymodactylos carnosus]CAF3551580.1 unnamed protein product [Didymodactylos carnosus]CAF3617300.1 unnamed protein product [Didymodactylos carnosus]